MMETAHKNEIEQSQVISLCLQDDFDDFSSGAKQSEKTTSLMTCGAKAEVVDKRRVGKQSREHANSCNMQASVCDGQQDLDLGGTKPSNCNLNFSTFNSRVKTRTIPSNILNHGMLYETSRDRITSDLTRGQHEHRQHRSFRLTEHFLEYSQLLQSVKIQKQIPLTSIVDIVYNEEENPNAFKLEFKNSEILLEADNKQDCELWVKIITEEWKKSFLDHTQSAEEVAENSAKEQGFFRTGKEVKGIKTAEGDTTQAKFPSLLSGEPRPFRSQHREFHDTEHRFIPCTSHTQIAMIQEKFGLIPRIHSVQSDRLQQKLDQGDDLGTLHDLDFLMIKYPRKKKFNSLPHERVFTMDYENLVIKWRQTEYSKFNRSNSLLIESIVEVREGQNSDGFAENKSFSLLVEGEMQAGPAGNTYAVLKSLDLVCDEGQEKQLWCRALKSIISPKRHLRMYSSRFEFIDPTILWLKFHWILLSEGGSEIKESIALSFGRSVAPQMPNNVIKDYIDLAHHYKLWVSIQRGSSLHWDSFILFYNLLCRINDSNCSLLKLFQNYTKNSPALGMTVEEFKKFLIEQQNWSPDEATDENCNQLMHRYDYYHRAFKMYVAKGNPKKFNIHFSFAGFLSFLRSVDNCIINREHENVYQDMSQPLSHYFINSSHNTYLEGHQLIGRSTTDAYVRALLQGCRCLELDCWDGPNGEPKITHGHTVVSELSLEEVARTINEYAFCVSDYPVILSLENHCNETQQAKMAEIFQQVFGSKLVTKNLAEESNFNRLPSPDKLKGKIILKGRISPDEKKAPDGRRKSDEKRKLNKNKKSVERKGIMQQVSAKTDETECDEEQKRLYGDLSRLVVYCQAIHIKPWNWEKQQQTSACKMFSFGESTASNKCKEYPKEMLACTERQLVRTYPSGLRTDSSNYDPILMWNHGIQMVALNIQTPGFPMFFNQGKFRQNGCCGYILKPKIMRDPNETVYNPNSMTKPHHAVTPVNLEITLLSGQNFMIINKKTSSMEIFYQTYGILHDCELLSHVASSDNTNPLWPQFFCALKLKKTILMPELCLVLFAVYINVHRKFKAGTKQVLLGQNVFPLNSLKSGIHFVPLRKPSGDQSSHIGIFIKIQLNQKQKLEVPISPLSHTQLSESLEDTNAIKNSQRNDSHMADVTNSESTHLSDGVNYKPQVTVTADVHFDHNSDKVFSDC